MADELERRVRTLEEELNGERHVSRYSVEQAGRNSEVLHAVRGEVALVRADISGVSARVDVMAGDVASVKAALAMHGRALDVLQQDIRQVRGEVTEINRRLDRMEQETNRRLDRMEQSIAAILAAVVPGGPPPA